MPLYNRGHGSILVAGIAHAAGNTVMYFLPNLNGGVFQATALATAVLLVLIDRMWRKLPAEHDAVAWGGGDKAGKTGDPQELPIPNGA